MNQSIQNDTENHKNLVDKRKNVEIIKRPIEAPRWLNISFTKLNTFFLIQDPYLIFGFIIA